MLRYKGKIHRYASALSVNFDALLCQKSAFKEKLLYQHSALALVQGGFSIR